MIYYLSTSGAENNDSLHLFFSTYRNLFYIHSSRAVFLQRPIRLVPQQPCGATQSPGPGGTKKAVLATGTPPTCIRAHPTLGRSRLHIPHLETTLQ